jgi:hypothetical protein
MAEVKRFTKLVEKTATKVEMVEVPMVTLTLTLEEAGILKGIMGGLGGSPDAFPLRKIVDEIYRVLAEARLCSTASLRTWKYDTATQTDVTERASITVIAYDWE